MAKKQQTFETSPGFYPLPSEQQPLILFTKIVKCGIILSVL
ncbi:hypothetical protein TREVI0001_1952 [Treponema vincentii ATCC 35580]|uniref:Uncharacterized protein n=1 Tax=Treponema vincentii ATCC 35580 TaxID=596324 RepID=C8PPK9_9SPIR|nr:hypothetical protein TREVI0001_1952 [Treponema vincentii ATCC 35580]